MVQPKEPPLSIRLGPARLARIDAYAATRGVRRHAAIMELLDLVLEAPPIVVNTAQTKSVPLKDSRGKAVKLQGVALHVDVPLIERKAFNPRPKGGKK